LIVVGIMLATPPMDLMRTILQHVGNNFTTNRQNLPHPNIVTCQDVELWHDELCLTIIPNHQAVKRNNNRFGFICHFSIQTGQIMISIS